MQSMFALELDVARTFFRSLKSPDGGPDPLAELPRLDDALIGRAREAGGTVYPDGFAVLGRDTAPQKIRILRWDPQDGEFVEHAAMERAQSFTDQTLRTAERSLQFAMQIQKVDGEKNIVHLSP